MKQKARRVEEKLSRIEQKLGERIEKVDPELQRVKTGVVEDLRAMVEVIPRVKQNIKVLVKKVLKKTLRLFRGAMRQKMLKPLAETKMMPMRKLKRKV